MDGFMKFSNVRGFVCHMATIIVILYIFIFYTHPKTSAVTVAAYLFWLSINVKGLFLATSCSVLVNHMVSTELFACVIKVKNAHS